ncbi:MAG TPA: cytochrome P450, partial [Nannocystis sp.]
MSSIINAKHTTDPRSDLPGPRGLPLIGSLPALLREGPFEYVGRTWREHGDMFQIPTLGRDRIVFISHPNELDRLLSHPEIYIKDRNYDPARPLFGEGLVTSNGDSWLAQRKLIQPMFNKTMLRSYAPLMVMCVREMLARWEKKRAAGEPIELAEEMGRLTHHVVGMTLFGQNLTDSAADAAQAVTDSLHLAGARVNRGALVLPLWMPTPSNFRFRKAIEILDRLVYGMIARARSTPAHPDEPPTLLRRLVDVRDEAGDAMSDRQLRDELLTHYVAGQETTALVMTWTLHLLSSHKEVAARIRSESAGLDDS